MKKQKFDLAIAYRIYPGISSNTYLRDRWKDKYQFAELCLKSLRKSLEGVNFKVFALLDGCDKEYDTLFRGLFDDVELIKYSPAIGNKATFSAQIDLLLRQDESEVVYFAEDDYLYQENTFFEMLDFLAEDYVDFITPYDHPDYYRRKDLHNCRSEVVFHGKRHWKTAASTCLTFLTTKGVLREVEKSLKSYSKLSDFALWLAITKLKRFDAPWPTLKGIYKHNPMEMLVGRAFRLWTPMPSIATHMTSTDLAPGIDWNRLIAKK